jgi:hypothetical protein
MKERLDLDRAALDGAEVTVHERVELSSQVCSRLALA